MRYIATIFSVLSLQTVYAQTCTNSVLETASDAQFRILNNGEVGHKETGLVWQRCAMGQTWNGSICVGIAQNLKWQDALREAKKTRSAYRLPNIKELSSITEHSCDAPALNTSIFPKVSGCVGFWTSSPYFHNKYSGHIWRVIYKDGSVQGDEPNFKNCVRLVRPMDNE